MPTLTYSLYRFLRCCTFSKYHLQKKSRGLSLWHFSSVERYICSWCATAVAFLSGLFLHWIFLSVPIPDVAPLVLPCMISGRTSIRRPFLRTVLYVITLVTDDNERTYCGKAAHSSKPVSHVTVKPTRGVRGLENMCRSADQWKKFSLTSDFCLFELQNTHTASLWSRRCAAVELQCSMWQSTVKRFPSDWFVLFVNAWGVMGLWKGTTFWSFFPKIQFLVIPNSHYPWYKWTLFFPEQDLLALEVTSFLLCPYFPSGRLLFLLQRTCQKFWNRSGPLCVWGLGFVLDVVFVFGVVLSWAVVSGSHSQLMMMSSPQVVVLLCDMMFCLFRAKDLFTRCKAGIQADSGTQAKLHCGVKLCVV